MRKKKSMYTLQLQCGISMFILLFEELVHVNDHINVLIKTIQNYINHISLDTYIKRNQTV